MPAAGSSKRILKELGIKRLRIKGAKPKTADEIKAEYDRLEDDLRTDHEWRLADEWRRYYEAIEDLRKGHKAELAEIEGEAKDVG